MSIDGLDKSAKIYYESAVLREDASLSIESIDLSAAQVNVGSLESISSEAKGSVLKLSDAEVMALDLSIDGLDKSAKIYYESAVLRKDASLSIESIDLSAAQVNVGSLESISSEAKGSVLKLSDAEVMALDLSIEGLDKSAKIYYESAVLREDASLSIESIDLSAAQVNVGSLESASSEAKGSVLKLSDAEVMALDLSIDGLDKSAKIYYESAVLRKDASLSIESIDLSAAQVNVGSLESISSEAKGSVLKLSDAEVMALDLSIDGLDKSAKIYYESAVLREDASLSIESIDLSAAQVNVGSLESISSEAKGSVLKLSDAEVMALDLSIDGLDKSAKIYYESAVLREDASLSIESIDLSAAQVNVGSLESASSEAKGSVLKLSDAEVMALDLSIDGLDKSAKIYYESAVLREDASLSIESIDLSAAQVNVGSLESISSEAKGSVLKLSDAEVMALDLSIDGLDKSAKIYYESAVLRKDASLSIESIDLSAAQVNVGSLESISSEAKGSVLKLSDAEVMALDLSIDGLDKSAKIYYESAVLREDASLSIESIDLSAAQVNVGSLESASSEAKGSVLKLSDAEVMALDLSIDGLDKSAKIYYESAVLREDASLSIESIDLSAAQVNVGSLESASSEAKGSVLKLSDAEVMALDLSIDGLDKSAKIYYESAVLREDASLSIESIDLSAAQVNVGSLESASSEAKGSVLKLSDAEVMALDLSIDGLDKSAKIYYESAVLRKDASLSIESIDLSAAQVNVGSLESISSEAKGSVLKLSDAEVMALDLSIDGLDKSAKIYYESAVLREDASLSIESIDLSAAQVNVGSLESASSEAKGSVLKLSDAEVMALDLSIDGLDKSAKIYYESAVLRKDASLSIESIDLSAAQVNVGSLESASSEAKGSVLKLSDAEVMALDLSIDGLDKSAKIYYESAVLRKDASLSIESIDLSAAQVNVGSLESISSEAKGSVLKLSDAEVMALDLSIDGLDKSANIYYESAVLREDASLSIESIDLSAAQVNVGSLESISSEAKGSVLKLSDAEVTALDLSIDGLDKSAKIYYESAVLREDASLSIESIDLSAAQVNVGSLERVSSEAKGSVLKLSNAEVTALDLSIEGLDKSAKIYDESAVLRKDASLSIESIDLSAAQVNVESLERVSSEAKGSVLKLSNAEVTALDLSIEGLDKSAKIYDESAVLREDASLSLESLDLSAAQVSVGSLERVSSGAGGSHEVDKAKSSSFTLGDVKVTTLDLSMKGYETVDKSYFGDGTLREFAAVELASIDLKAETLELMKFEQASSRSSDGLESSTLSLSAMKVGRLDMSLSGLEMTKELYGEDATLEKKTVYNIGKLSAKIKSVSLISFNSGSVVDSDGVVTDSNKDMSLDLSGVLLEANMVEFSSRGIDENGQQASWGLGVTDIGIAFDQLSFSSGAFPGEDDAAWYSIEVGGVVLETGIMEFTSQSIGEDGAQNYLGVGIAGVGASLEKLKLNSKSSGKEDGKETILSADIDQLALETGAVEFSSPGFGMETEGITFSLDGLIDANFTEESKEIGLSTEALDLEVGKISDIRIEKSPKKLDKVLGLLGLSDADQSWKLEDVAFELKPIHLHAAGNFRASRSGEGSLYEGDFETLSVDVALDSSISDKDASNGDGVDLKVGVDIGLDLSGSFRASVSEGAYNVDVQLRKVALEADVDAGLHNKDASSGDEIRSDIELGLDLELEGLLQVHYSKDDGFDIEKTRLDKANLGLNLDISSLEKNADGDETRLNGELSLGLSALVDESFDKSGFKTENGKTELGLYLDELDITADGNVDFYKKDASSGDDIHLKGEIKAAAFLRGLAAEVVLSEEQSSASFALDEAKMDANVGASYLKKEVSRNKEFRLDMEGYASYLLEDLAPPAISLGNRTPAGDILRNALDEAKVDAGMGVSTLERDTLSGDETSRYWGYKFNDESEKDQIEHLVPVKKLDEALKTSSKVRSVEEGD